MSSGRLFRSFVLLLAISATLLVSTVAASPAHFHTKDLGGGCDVCAIAHLPVIQPDLAVHIAAPGVSKVRLSTRPVESPREPFVQNESSRGPPSFPFVLA
jgi:hypothetical protein